MICRLRSTSGVGSGEQVDSTSASGRHLAQQQRAVAPDRVAFEAQQGARLLGGKLAHLRRGDDRFGEFELPGVDPLELGMAPLARRLAAFGRRAERLQMDIFDPRLGEPVREDVLREPGLRDSGTARTSISRSTPAA